MVDTDRSDYYRRYYAAHREKCREAQRRYQAANREKVREAGRLYYAANLEKRRDYNANKRDYRRYYAANREKCREAVRRYKAANREKLREAQRRYQAENLEKCREAARRYQAANREKTREASRRIYYKKRGIKPGDIRHKIYEERALKFLLDQGFELVTGASVKNVECTETHTHRYPDALLWCKGFPIIAEIDEKAHRGAAYDCDFRRMAEICGCLGTPVWFIRYKPDAPESDLNQLLQKINEIQELPVDSIEWEFYNFNVTYLFYSKTDRECAEERKRIAFGNDTP